MAKKILSGIPVQQIPVIDKSPNKYIFDYNMLKKFTINQNSLPSGSIILNKKASFYDNYKNYIWPILIIFIIMAFFIVYLLRNISIAMDDFGTGYSSLKYLNLLPIDTLKIDKSFVDDIAKNNIDKNFIDIIIALAHRMGLKVVAEGVETEIQKSVLTSQGCDKIQGYIFSKPLAEYNAIEYKRNF